VEREVARVRERRWVGIAFTFCAPGFGETAAAFELERYPAWLALLITAMIYG
jgi:hypothetical protein